MKKTVARIAIGSAIATLFSTVSLAGALPQGVRDTYNRQAPRQYATGCGTGNQLYFDGPARLWPPNHKYYAGLIAVTAVDAQNNRIDLNSTGIHNQYEGDTEWNGSGHTADDIALADGEDAEIQSADGAAEVVANDTGNAIVSIAWKVRSERSGHKTAVDGQGRVYTITGEAAFTDGTCKGSWQIIVPHDMSVKNR
ncbi:MAG: hypothetical protein ABIS18_11265 [Actinomycetota bacterium]